MNNYQEDCINYVSNYGYIQGPLLLTWFNFNPIMDK